MRLLLGLTVAGYGGVVDAGAEAGGVGDGQIAFGVDADRLSQEEVAAFGGPAGRVVRELDVGAAAHAGYHVQVGQQAEAVGPGVRGEPAVPQQGQFGDGPGAQHADGEDHVGLQHVQGASRERVKQFGRGPGHLTARHRDLPAQRAHAVQVAAGQWLLEPEHAEFGEFGGDPADLSLIERGREVAGHPPPLVEVGHDGDVLADGRPGGTHSFEA